MKPLTLSTPFPRPPNGVRIPPPPPCPLHPTKPCTPNGVRLLAGTCFPKDGGQSAQAGRRSAGHHLFYGTLSLNVGDSASSCRHWRNGAPRTRVKGEKMGGGWGACGSGAPFPPPIFSLFSPGGAHHSAADVRRRRNLQLIPCIYIFSSGPSFRRSR